MTKYYVTTAIAYVNGRPHMGHMLEFLQADLVARYHRLVGDEVYFLTGTDEHGQKIVETAKAQGVATKDLVDKNAGIFQDFTRLLNLSNDDFIRTSDQKKHWPSVVRMWKTLAANGDIYKKKYTGLYCVGCEKFITEKELDADGNCPYHGKPPKEIQEENYFFRLSKYAGKVHDLIKGDELLIIPQSRKNEILSFLAGDVKDVSFSRNKKALPWGVPVPGDPDQVMYVWCDALTNYISALDYANEGPLYKKFWPADVHIIGKDILRFHAAIWPAMHLSAGVPLPKCIFVHGFVNAAGQKMSKSLGNVISPYEQIEKFGVEAVRFYLLKELPSYEDGDYSEELLIESVNGDLANTLGNLVRRATVLIEKNFDSNIPKPVKREKPDEELASKADFFKEFDSSMQRFDFPRALERLWQFVRDTNKYLTETEPWKIKDGERLGTVLYHAIEAVRVMAHYISPLMPATAEKIFEQIGQANEGRQGLAFRLTTKGRVKRGEILFAKITETAELEDPFSKVDLRVAKVLKVEDHPEAEKLYVLQIDVGSDGVRQLVAGLKGHLSKDEIKGKHIIIVSNLKPAVLRGKESRGMLLAADDGKKVVLLEAPGTEPGEAVSAEGLECKPAPKLDIREFSKLGLEVRGGKALYKGRALRSPQEEIIADAPDGSKIR